MSPSTVPQRTASRTSVDESPIVDMPLAPIEHMYAAPQNQRIRNIATSPDATADALAAD